MIGQQIKKLPKHIISSMVGTALAEDIASGDITAQIIPIEQTNNAVILTREDACICGIEWVNEVFMQVNDFSKAVDPIIIDWHVIEGEKVKSNTVLCNLFGNTRQLLTGERCALNFLQTLSGTATSTWKSTQHISNNTTKLLDTRKTIPAMRLAQKYAVACGGGYNHRLGLYDAFLIKENHIAAAGSITAAMQSARALNTQKSVQIEVENLSQLKEALGAGANSILLDNFSTTLLTEAVSINQQAQHPAILEASGNVSLETVRSIALTGVDRISIGSLTKNVQAIDLSMRFS